MAKVPEAILNPPDTTLGRLQQGTITSRQNRRMGGADTGDACQRRRWLKFRWAEGPFEEITKPLSRIFRDGHRIEDQIVEDLESIGITITDRQTEMSELFGHAISKIDGIATNVPEAPKTPHLFEGKSYNIRRFNELKKKGVKKSDPKYYAQCQTYMKELGLTRTLFVAYSKNDGNYWVERLYLENSFAMDLERRTRAVIMAPEMPEAGFNVGWHECGWCKFQAICRDGSHVKQNCRTCFYGDIHNDGIWRCGFDTNEPILSVEQQQSGCEKWRSVIAEERESKLV